MSTVQKLLAATKASLSKPVSELTKKELALGGLGSLGVIGAAKALAPELGGVSNEFITKVLSEVNPNQYEELANIARQRASSRQAIDSALASLKAIKSSRLPQYKELAYFDTLAPLRERYTNLGGLPLIGSAFNVADLGAQAGVSKALASESFPSLVGRITEQAKALDALRGKVLSSSPAKIQEGVSAALRKANQGVPDLTSQLTKLRQGAEDVGMLPFINRGGAASEIQEAIVSGKAQDLLKEQALKKIVGKGAATKFLGPLGSILDTASSRFDLDKAQGFSKLLSQQIDSLPANFRMPQGVQSAIDSIRERASEMATKEVARASGEGALRVGKGLTEGASAAQGARYGVGQPILF